MSKPKFVYVTYIRTTPERLWNALTDPAVMRQYWFGVHGESDWKAGSCQERGPRGTRRSRLWKAFYWSERTFLGFPEPSRKTSGATMDLRLLKSTLGGSSY